MLFPNTIFNVHTVLFDCVCILVALSLVEVSVSESEWLIGTTHVVVLASVCMYVCIHIYIRNELSRNKP